MKLKGKPSITCPDCGYRLLNAGSRDIKNETVVAVINNENKDFDYTVFCPHCKKYVGIKSKQTKYKVVGITTDRELQSSHQ